MPLRTAAVLVAAAALAACGGPSAPPPSDGEKPVLCSSQDIPSPLLARRGVATVRAWLATDERSGARAVFFGPPCYPRTPSERAFLLFGEGAPIPLEGDTAVPRATVGSAGRPAAALRPAPGAGIPPGDAPAFVAFASSLEGVSVKVRKPFPVKVDAVCADSKSGLSRSVVEAAGAPGLSERFWAGRLELEKGRGCVRVLAELPRGGACRLLGRAQGDCRSREDPAEGFVAGALHAGVEVRLGEESESILVFEDAPRGRHGFAAVPFASGRGPDLRHASRFERYE